MSAPQTGVHYEPPVPARTLALWRDELHRIAPRSDVLSWLHVGWVSGDPWETSEAGAPYRPTRGIGRWIIFQMTPMDRIPALVLEDLEGPHPRTLGRWDPFAVCRECDGARLDCPVCAGRGRGAFVQERPVSVNRYQWDLFREHGCWAQMYWVVQGSMGGHLRRYTQVQSKLSVMEGGPACPPAIGDLPYAEPDRRTWAALAARDNVRKFDLMLDYAERRPEQVEAAHAEAYRDMREQMWRFLSGQLESRLRDEKPLLRHIKETLPVASTARPGRTPEQIHESFIHRV